jgi:hypothetical protein
MQYSDILRTESLALHCIAKLQQGPSGSEFYCVRQEI